MTQLAINTIRTLAIDAVQQARSQHPGTPITLVPLTVRSFDALRSRAPNGVIGFVIAAAQVKRSKTHIVVIAALATLSGCAPLATGS